MLIFVLRCFSRLLPLHQHRQPHHSPSGEDGQRRCMCAVLTERKVRRYLLPPPVSCTVQETSSLRWRAGEDLLDGVLHGGPIQPLHLPLSAETVERANHHRPVVPRWTVRPVPTARASFSFCFSLLVCGSEDKQVRVFSSDRQFANMSLFVMTQRAPIVECFFVGSGYDVMPAKAPPIAVSAWLRWFPSTREGWPFCGRAASNPRTSSYPKSISWMTASRRCRIQRRSDVRCWTTAVRD